MTWKNVIPCLVILTMLLGCQTSSKQVDIERAHDPWVFRSVLDGQARMLTLALHDDVWAAYNSQNANIYKVWKGGVNFDGAVYTTVHGPQPSTLGDAYFINAVENPWQIEIGGQIMIPEVDYKGHLFNNGQVTLKYDLILFTGDTISVEETPEYLEVESGQPGFERTFKLGELPSQTEVFFQFNVASIASARSLETNADLRIIEERQRQVDNIEALDVGAAIRLKPDEPTYLRVSFTKPLIENDNKVVGAEEEERRPLGYRLIARNDCKTCHNTYVKTIGPAYVEVARKYRNTPSNVDMLASKVKKGGFRSMG